MTRQRWIILAFSAFLIGMVALQWVIATDGQQRMQQALSELSALSTTSLSDEKTRQELIALRLQNEQHEIFLQNFIANFSVGAGIVIALSGALVGLNQFLEIRAKARADQAADTMRHAWEGVTSKDLKVRAGSIAGLQPFLSKDKADFHERVAAALALAGRLDGAGEAAIQRTLVPVIELALQQIPRAMRKVSWQGVHLVGCDFSRMDLSGYDFRNAYLRSCVFRDATLDRARFDAADLIGADFTGAHLRDANLEYADLAKASLRQADLQGARLRNLKLLDLDLDGANMSAADFSEATVDWRLTRGWRQATYSAGIRERLLQRYGPEASGPRILLLLWEFPPQVLGGTWTANYHLIHNLRLQGANLAVLVPWAPTRVSLTEFGNEVPVIAVGEGLDEEEEEGASDRSSQEPYLTYPLDDGSHRSRGDSNTTDYAGPRDLEREQAFVENALRALEDGRLVFDVIHAQDWLTFRAAEALSTRSGKPWVAHFHSTEQDRRTDGHLRHTIARIEATACHAADHLVTPSRVTQDQLATLYDADLARTTVVPNSLSPQSTRPYPVGEPHAQRVVFLGRLSHQKGPDLFIEMAQRVRECVPSAHFDLYGKGDLKPRLEDRAERLKFRFPPPFVSPGGENGAIDVAFGNLRAIDFDAATDTYEELDEGTYSSEVEPEVVKRGFTAFALTHSYWTHRLVVNDQGDEFHRDYVAIARYLPGAVRVSKESIVEIHDYLEWRLRWRAFDGASVIAVPSRAEPFGLVVLEAMQAGVPVVFTDVAGVREVIESGVRVPVNDVQALTDAVVALLTDEAHWQLQVERQWAEIAHYPDRGYERVLSSVWRQLARTD